MAINSALFINGRFVETAVREEVRNPYDGSVVGTVCIGGEKEVEDAISSAEKAFSITKNQSRGERSAVLSSIADLIRKRARDFSNIICAEAGKPIRQAEREVQRAINTFTIASEEAKRIGGEIVPVDLEKGSAGYQARVERFPLGPVAAISPFNFPLNLVAHKVAPAIAAGNTVVHKPAHNTPLSAFMLAQAISESGAVPGTYNMVQCKRPHSELLATDKRLKLLTFTGSAEVGWHLKRLAYDKKVTLELGGNCTVIVDAASDLKWAAKRCAEGAFAYAGQICISVQRIFVERDVFKNFLEIFSDEASKLKCGNPADEETFVGPLIDGGNADRIMEWIKEAKEKGASVVFGGERKGNVISPTALTSVGKDCRIYREEAFGPVVVIEPCSNFFEGIKSANDTKFGLQASIFTHDLRKIERAFREIEVGGLIVNDYPTLRMDNYPYGGVKESGTGREGVRYAMEEMTELKTVVFNMNR